MEQEAYAALLRGVNVGGATALPNKSFLAALASLGFGNAKTLLNSGNAVFLAQPGPGPSFRKKSWAL